MKLSSALLVSRFCPVFCVSLSLIVLQHCRSIRRLSLQKNTVGDLGCAAICDAVCDVVEDLNLSQNNITLLPLRWQLQAGTVSFYLPLNPLLSPPNAVV